MANRLMVAKVSSINELRLQGWSLRRIARTLGVSRGAVARQLDLSANGAQATGESEGSNRAKAPPGSDDRGTSSNGATPNAQAPIGSRSLCEPFRELILEKLQAGLSAQRIFQDLVADQAFSGAYFSVRRYVAQLRKTEAGSGLDIQLKAM